MSIIESNSGVAEAARQAHEATALAAGVVVEAGIQTRSLDDDAMQRLVELATNVSVAAIGVEEGEAAHPMEEPYRTERDPLTGEIIIHSRITLEDIRRITPEEDMALLEDLARQMQDESMLFINATRAGGGVAIMRAPLVHTLRLLGVDAHWYTLNPDEAVFDITKNKFHNVMQKKAKPGVMLTDSDEELFEAWSADNAVLFGPAIKKATKVIIDDWQPTGTIKYIKGFDIAEDDPLTRTPGFIQFIETYGATKEDGIIHVPGLNEDALLIVRDHIQTHGKDMVDPAMPAQYRTWDFLYNRQRICDADVFPTHPRHEFVPPNVPDSKVVFMPATCDRLDGLNEKLNEAQVAKGFEFINRQLAEQGQQPLRPTDKYMVLMARFDPAKGMDLAIDYYTEFRKMMIGAGVKPEDIPKLVIAGNGSVDDTDLNVIYPQITEKKSRECAEFLDDVKVVHLPHDDRAVNALLTKAWLGLQPSTAEGFEDRVTSLILHGVPVLGSLEGGIPWQIKNGDSGFVIDPYDVKTWAFRMFQMATDPDLYGHMKRRTAELAQTKNYEFTTIWNAGNWLYLCINAKKPGFRGDRRWVRDMVFQSAGRPLPSRQLVS